MPIYEYGCDKCGTFEVSQRITDKPLRRCPTCKGKVRKLISSTSFQLKGSGWYVTDYASKGSKAKEDSKESGKEGKEGKSHAADTAKESSSEASKESPAKESSAPSTKKADGKKTEATAA